MQGFAAANLLLLAVVTFVVGVRLLRVALRTRRLPELLFGVAFVFGSLGTAGGQLGQRLLWTQPGPFAAAMNAACFALVALSTFALFATVWRVFRPRQRAAAAGFALGTGLTLAAYAMRLGGGDFPSGNLESPGMALFHTTRIALFGWSAAEALLYHAKLRRQLSIGLGGPVAAAQILLWGVAGLAMVGFSATILVSVFLLHRNPLDLPLAMALVTALVLTTSVAMWCAFFPPAALRRHAEARSLQTARA
jgi:hypothetical protein